MNHCDVTAEQQEATGSECDFGSFKSLEVVAGDGVKSLHPATERLLSTVCVNGQDAEFQLDTAASGCMMSQVLFNKLQKKARRKLQVKHEKLPVRLADGSCSKKLCKSVWLSVKPHHLARPHRINFLVVKGGKNLLGRWAMCQLWPEQFKAFKSAVCASWQPKSSLVPRKISAHQLSTPVVAEAAGSMTSLSALLHQSDVADIMASVAALSTNVSSLTQIVRDMQGHVHSTGAGAWVQLVGGTPEPEGDSMSCGGSIAESETSLSSVGCELMVFGDFE